jgi:hypothetical protein
MMQLIIEFNVPNKELKNNILLDILGLIEENFVTIKEDKVPHTEIYFLRNSKLNSEFLFKVFFTIIEEENHKISIFHLTNRYVDGKIVYVVSDFKEDHYINDKKDLIVLIKKLIDESDYEN